MKQSRAATLLMTRPLPQAKAFAADILSDQPQLRVIYSPVLKIEPTEVPRLDGAQGLVFTSQNGVQIFARMSDRRDLPAYCLGDRTTLAAQQAGLRAQKVGHDASTLVEKLPGKNPPNPLVHLRGEQSVGEVSARLTQAGIPCDGQVIYRQVPAQITPEAKAELHGNNLILIPIFSPMTARILSEQIVGATAPLVLVCISDAVAKAWYGPAPFATVVADMPDAVSLRSAVLGAIATSDQLEGPRSEG